MLKWWWMTSWFGFRQLSVKQDVFDEIGDIVQLWRTCGSIYSVVLGVFPLLLLRFLQQIAFTYTFWIQYCSPTPTTNNSYLENSEILSSFEHQNFKNQERRQKAIFSPAQANKTKGRKEKDEGLTFSFLQFKSL